ncbi:excalibur calcium-binding domain-containing protein [Streptomyces flavotricini]|uniref:excalibur calcium-binding domain-containing protein n=1 Tax=Streptomyces flavotricini TaxID=66888 RepID=UPI001E2EE745|nr:excalibur calcium-binding domain-containing protein [Streptomyces flavotricini]
MAAVLGAVVVLGSGCEGPAPKAGAVGAGSGVNASPSASAAAMPSFVGQKFADAGAAVKKLVSKPVEVRSAYSDVPLASDHAGWAVCFQTPAAGAPVEQASTVELSLVAPGRPCPDKAGAVLVPSKAPAASATPAVPKPKTSPPTDGGSTGGDTGGSGAGSSAYYKTCADARAAGAAPMRRGQPGYRSALDKDQDGIACDK